jgi:hypothetical protein
MQIFVFRSDKDNDVFGFTGERHGRNLPAEFAPWTPLGHNEMTVGNKVSGVTGGADAVTKGIARDGFFVARAGNA